MFEDSSSVLSSIALHSFTPLVQSDFVQFDDLARISLRSGNARALKATELGSLQTTQILPPHPEHICPSPLRQFPSKAQRRQNDLSERRRGCGDAFVQFVDFSWERCHLASGCPCLFRSEIRSVGYQH